MQKEHIRCPKCDWEPTRDCQWVCDICNTKWNTFDTHGQCPGCGKAFSETQCLWHRYGCGYFSPHQDWYHFLPQTNGFWDFAKRKEKLPILKADKVFVEHTMVTLREKISPQIFDALKTITPDNVIFNFILTGKETDSRYLAEKISSVMEIDFSELEPVFYSYDSLELSENIPAEEQETTNSSFGNTGNELNGKRIWLQLAPTNLLILITDITNQLAKYKLLRLGIEKNDFLVRQLTSFIYGFGIFIGNYGLDTTQWKQRTYRDTKIRIKSFLPHSVMAYAMAWLAHCRNEDISWKQYFNKTMQKHFDRSYNYIAQNKDKVRWE